MTGSRYLNVDLLSSLITVLTLHAHAAFIRDNCFVVALALRYPPIKLSRNIANLLSGLNFIHSYGILIKLVVFFLHEMNFFVIAMMTNFVIAMIHTY